MRCLPTGAAQRVNLIKIVHMMRARDLADETPE